MGKKRMKRAVSWLLALSLVSALLPPAAVGAQAAPQTAPVTETVTRTTQPGTVGQTTAEPVMVDQTTLQPGAADQTTPQPETVDQTTPEPETADRTTPQPETTDRTTPQPRTVDQTTPEPEAVDQPTPEPETVDQTTPEPVPQNSALNGTRNGTATLTVVGPGGNEYGTAEGNVIHPLSRFQVTGNTSTTLMIRKGNTTSEAGTIGENGLSDMICNLGGWGGLGLTDGQEYTFYLGDSFDPEATLTVTYQAAIPSEDLTVQNFAAEAGSDLMVNLSWDHPAANPTGDGWTYTLSGYAAGSSSTVYLYQQDGSSTTSLTVTGQTAASVATDPSLGPVTFVLTVAPGVAGYQYYQKTSVVGPNPSTFTESVAPTVSISTNSYLSGLTYKASATVTDTWGTPSYAEFTIEKKDGDSYTDTNITGTAYVKSTAFNGSAYTSTVELNLFGQEPGDYRLKAVGYDTCNNPSEPAYKEFTLTGSETGYPLLTGLTAIGTSTGVTVDASNLQFTEEAITQIWEKVEKLNITTYTGRPQSIEELEAELSALLKTAKVQYKLEYYADSFKRNQERSVPAEGEGSWNYDFPVGMIFASGKPQLAGNLSSSIRPGGQYNFVVSLNFNFIDGYYDKTQYGWISQIYLNNWCTSAPVLCGMSGDAEDPQAGEIQLLNPVAADKFDRGSSFTVTASDDVLLQGGQFFWRKSGTSQWSAGEAPTAAAAESGNGVTFTADYRTMFGNTTNLTMGQYDIRFLGTDWAGKTVIVKKTFTYGKLPAPENVQVSVEENAATVSWDPVEGAASYRIYVRGTAQNTTVTDTSYTFYMEPKGEDTYTYYFAVAALTTGGGEGERSADTEWVSSGPDVTKPQVTSVESTDKYGEHSFTITGSDNGRVKSYRWQLLPKDAETVLLEIGKADKKAGDIHGELKIYDWMDTKDVLRNRLNSVLYPVRSFPDGTPNPTYFTQNGDGTYTLQDGLYRLRVYVYDTAGNESEPFDYQFRVANVGPDLPVDFPHQAKATLSVNSGTSSLLTGTISWDSLPEGSPGVRLWYPSNKYYGTKDARQEAMDAISDASDIPAGFTLANYPTADNVNSYTMTLRANNYYFYVIAAYNEFGTAGPIQFGTFDTCFENDPLNVTAVTFNDVDIQGTGGTELEQGGTLSVTVTSEVVTGGYAQLCRVYEGEVQVLAGGPYGGGDQFFKEQEDGTYAATLEYRIPDNDDFTWSGPQNVYVRLSHNSYTHIRTEDIPVNLKIMVDEEKPYLNSVTPDFGGAISGEAFAFTLNAWDNSKVIDKVRVWQSPYGADDWTSLGEFSWNGGKLTLDTTKLTANASGNIMLKFAVTDKAGNESEAKSGAYALANSPIPAPTGLTAAAGERQIVLNWNPVQRLDAAGYNIYRAVDNGEYVLVDTVSGNDNSYTDTDNGAYLDPTKAYSYKVAAYSDQIEEEYLSAATNWIYPEEQTGAPTILSLEPWQGSAFRSPVTVTAKVQDDIGVTSVKLEFAWLGTSSTAEPTGETQWQEIQTFTGLTPDAEGGRTYTVTAQWSLDTAAVTESWYALRVTASNNSAKTAVSTVKCRYDNQAPNQVSGLTATDEGSGGAIRLNFTASSSPDVQKYVVYRGDSDSFTGAANIGETAAGAYRDSTCVKGTTYFYWVTAVDRAGNESGPAGPVSASAGAECDVAVTQPPVLRDSVLTVGRSGTIAVTVHNAGPARAGGKLTLTADYGSGAQDVGSVTFGAGAGDTYALLRAGEAREVLFTLTPAEGESVTLRAAFANDDSTAEDTNTGNNAMATEALPLNHAPDAVWNLSNDALSCNSGEAIALTAQGSTDKDSDDLTYLWEIGGEGKTGMAVSHRFMTPGSYPVTLTVTDARGAATALTGTITVADNRPDLYVASIQVERKGAGDADYSAVDETSNPIQEGDAVKVTAVIGNDAAAGPVPSDMSFLTSLIRNGVSLGYQTLTGLEAGATKSVTFHYTAEAGAQVLKVVTNDILQVISEPDMTNNVMTVQYNAEQVEFADIVVTDLAWTNLNNPGNPTDFTTQDQVIWSATVANNGDGDADATFTLTLYVDGQVAAQRQVSRAKGASSTESFTIAPTAGAHTVTLTAGGELMDSNEDNNSATVKTEAFTVAVPKLTLSEITIEPTDTANPVQGSTLRFTTRVSSTVNITVPFSVTFQVDGKPLKTVQLDRGTGSNVVLYANQPQEVFAEWVVADGSHTVTITADPDRAVVSEPVVQTAVTQELTVRKPDLWLSDVYNAPADTMEFGNEAKFTVRVSNRSTATLFDKYALVVWAARWTGDTEPAESAYEVVSRTQYNGIQGNSTSIQILSFRPKNSGTYSVRVGLEPVGNADFDTTYYQPYTFKYTVKDGMTLTTSPNKDGESNDFGANMFLESMKTIPVKASAKMADGTVLTAAAHGLTITASILGTDRQVNLVDGGNGNFSADLSITGLETQNYTLRFDAAYGGYSAAYETQIVLVQDVKGSLSVTDNTNTVYAVDSDQPGLQVAAGTTPVTISGTLKQGDDQPYTGTIVLEMDLLPSYEQQPNGTVVEGDASGVAVWYRGQKILFIDKATAEERADITYENGTFTYRFTPQAKESGKWVVRAYAYDRLMGSGIISTAFTVYGMEPSPRETVVTMTKGSTLSIGDGVTLDLHNGAWGGSFGNLNSVNVTLTPKENYPGITVAPDWEGLSNVLPAGTDPLSIPVSITTQNNADTPDYAEYTVDFSAVSGDANGGSIPVSATATLKIYLRPATASPKATPANVVVSANPGDTIKRTVTVKNNGMGDWTGITIGQPGLNFIRADNLSKTEIGQWESLTFDVTFAPLSSTQLGRYQDKVVLKNADGSVACTIPVALEVTALDTGTVTFQVTSDLGNPVKDAQIKLYGKDPQIQIVNGVQTEYYLNYSLTTDKDGLALLEGKPAGAYDYVITAQGMETYEGVLELMPGLSGQAEAVTLTTLPVQITWTVTETTIVDQYEIKLNIDMGVTIPTPRLASTSPWFTIPKQVDNPITLTTNIVNNSLVDVYDVTAQIVYENNPGISVVGGGYIGTIPAMSYKTVQIVVQPGTYELASRPKAQAALQVKGSYLSYDADGLPEMPAKELSLGVGIYNPGTSKVTVDTTTNDYLNLTETLEVSMPEDVDVSELEYLLLWNGELGTQKPENPGGSVMELVKMELSQTASLERQAFDATLTVTNNYTGGITLQGLTANVVVEHVEEDGTVTDATALMYILPQRTAPSILQPGQTATLTWKLIPGEGMGGENGIKYQVRADVGYTVVTPGEDGEEPVSKPVQTSTQAVEITVNPQPSLTVDYFLPHKVYPGEPFNLDVVVINSGHGPAQNVVLDSSQLEIVENKSGLVGTWQIVGTSFGPTSGSGPTTSFRVTLGDVPAGQTVKGYYTIRWDLPTGAGGLGDDVYGEVLNFTATLTHKPYEGVELNPLITAVYTHIVGKDQVTIKDESQTEQTVKVIMGDHGLPAFFWNTATNVRLPLYVPRAVSDGTLVGETYTFTAPETAETPDTTGARHAVLMIGEVAAMTGIPVTAVYRYDDPSMTGTPVTLSHGNYWKDTYKNAEGKDTDYLYIVDELRLENGVVQPRYYKVVYGSGVVLQGPATSQILYDDNGQRTAVLYETGRNHELNDDVDALLSVKAVNNSGNAEDVTVYFYAARYVNGEAQDYKYLGSVGLQTLEPSASADFTYIWELGLTSTNRPTIAGTYRVKMTTLSDALTAEAAASAPGVTADITFNAAPIADAGVDFSVDYGQPAVFDGTRSYDPDGGTIALYVWDFGDGQSGFGPTPSHTYRASGSYIATLYVVDDNGTENALEQSSWTGGRPTTSSAVHDVMVTVEETRPDLILEPTGGLTITNGSTFSEGQEVTLRAVIKNDKAAPVTDNFIATLYVDNVYQGYQRINLYDNGGDGKLAHDETVTVGFTYTMPDSKSHVATVKVNDVSLLVDEADLLNNQRSIVIRGSDGVTTFPDLALSNVKVDGTAPEKGVVWAGGNGIISLNAGASISITATVKNGGTAAAEATAVILYANGEYAGMATLGALEIGGSQDVTINFTPEVSGSYDFTLLADGPIAKLVEQDKTNNQAEFSLPLAEVLYPDLVITALSAAAKGGGSYDLTATVENQGDAQCPAGLEVAFYAGGRYAGAGKTTSPIAVGDTAQITLTWTDATAADTLMAVANQGGRIPELEQTNNTYTVEEGVNIAAAPRPTLVVTGVTTSGPVAFGQKTAAQVSIQNTGSANAGAFTVSLYLNGALAGSAVCDGLGAGESTDVTVTWVADQLSAGADMTLTAVADSQYQIVMGSRDGVVKEIPVTVGRGVLVTLRDPGTLTRNGQNDLAAQVTDSEYGLYTSGASVTFYLDEQPLGTGIYDESTGTYRLNADLTGMSTGEHTLRAVAAMDGGAYTGEATRTVTLAAPVGITLDVSETVLAAGETLTLSGTTEKVAEGATVTMTLAGCGVYQYTTQVGAEGNYALDLTLPADLGGAVTASASVTQSGITKTASKALSVYGAYVSLPAALTVTQGYSQTMTASAVNMGYTDLTDLTLKAANVPGGFTVKFRGTGGVYEIDGAAGITAASLARTENPVSVNGAEPEYAALDFGLQIAAAATVEPGDYTLTFTLTGTTGDPNPGRSVSRTLTVKVTVRQANADLRIDTGDEENPGSVIRSIRPGQTVTSLVRAWNAGEGDLTDIKITAPDLPWVNLAIAGLGEGNTLAPYRASAQRLSIQVVAAPAEKVEAGTYTGKVVITAKNNGAEVTQNIPVTFHVSAAQIGTAVLELWDEDSVPVPAGAKVALYGPAEAAEPQLYTVTLGDYGKAQLTNYPAGTYTLTFRHSGFEDLEQTFVLYPTIDLDPRRVTVERRQFQVTVSTDTVTALEGVTGDNQAFYDIIYQLETQPTDQAGLAFNYPADEFEASYSLGRVSSRISVRNSCLEGTGAFDETLHDVAFTLLSDDPDYEGLITFRGESGSVSTITLNELAPGAQLDLVWEVAESALYVRAGVAEVADRPNTYTLTLPADCGLVWNGEKGMFPTWNSENGNQYILMGVSDDGRTATVLARTDAQGTTAPAPDSRVPKVQLVDQNGEYIAGGWYLDFTLLARGERWLDETGTNTQVITRTVPLRVSYVSSGYYLAANSARTALDVRVEAAFPALSGVGYKYFSETFLSYAQIGSSQVSGSGFSLGFSHTTAYENETQVLQVRFDNPSALNVITDLTFELMVSDLPPENGLLAPGGSLKNAAFMATPSIDGGAARVNPDGSITVDTVAVGKGVTASFLMTPTLEVLDLTILDDFVDSGYMTQEEAQAAAQWLSSLNGDYYAWLNYSYTLDGKTYSGSTPAVQQSARPVAQLASSYALEAGEGNDWYLNAVITNTSSSQAEGVVLMTPSLPVVEGVTVQLLAGTWALSGEEFPSGWEDTPYSGELEVGTIPGGATIRARYKLLVLDGTNGNAPISFVSADDTSGGSASTLALRSGGSTRADPTAYEQYRQSLLNMVSKNGVSDSNAYQSISVITLSGDAKASPEELQQIIRLLELLNADPSDADAEALIQQLASSRLTSETLLALLTDPATAGSYGMESLYAVTEEKYAYALSDYLYAISSLERWDKWNATVDAWAGNVSLVASVTGVVGKLGGAGVSAMASAYRTGNDLSGMWNAAKKAVKEEYKAYVKPFKGLGDYWDYIKETVKNRPQSLKDMVNLKPYQDLLKLLRSAKAGYTAATGAKGVESLIQQAKQLDRFLLPTKVSPPVLVTKNGQKTLDLVGGMVKSYEDQAEMCNFAIKEYQQAVGKLKDTNLLFASEAKVQEVIAEVQRAASNAKKSLTVMEEFIARDMKSSLAVINTDANFTQAQQKAIAEYIQTLSRAGAADFKNGSFILEGMEEAESMVKTLSASAQTMRDGQDSVGTLLGATGMVKDLAKAVWNSFGAIQEGNWGQLLLEIEGTTLMMFTNGDGAINGINGVLVSMAAELISVKNAEAAQNSAAGLLTVYQAVSDQVYEILYKGTTPPHWPGQEECMTLANAFGDALQGLQGDEKDPPSWIKLPAGSEIASYQADLTKQLLAISEANEDVTVSEPKSKPDIFDDEMYQTIMDFFTHAYVERLMVATTSGKDPIKILLDLDLSQNGGWVDESVLVNALTQTQSLMSLRENASATLDRGIESTYALLRDGDALSATYPTAAMMAYLEELNAYILAAGDDGRSMSGLSPLPVYQRGSGKQVTGTLVNYYELRQALAAQNSALSMIYDTTNDSIDYANYNYWFRSAMATADSMSMVLSFTSASGLGSLLGNVSAGVSIGYDIYAFIWGNSHQNTAKNAIGVVQSRMPQSMRSMTTLLAQQAQVTENTGELFGALAQWSKIDPELPVEVLSFSVSDAEAAPGQSSGSGQLRVAFLNGHSDPVQIHPTVLFLSRQGVLTEMPLEAMALAAGESSEQTAAFQVPTSTLMDPGGYIALLTWSVSEGTTATVTRSSGPVTARFWAGEQSVLSKMRGSGAKSVIVASAACGEEQGTELTGTFQVTGGVSEVRFFLAAQSHSGAELTVTGPNGEITGDHLTKLSLLNEGDYWILTSPAAGAYSVRAMIPAGTSGQASIEALALTGSGAVLDVHSGDTVGMGKDLRGNTTSGTLEVILAESGCSAGAGAVSFTLTDENGDPWTQPGLTWSFFGTKVDEENDGFESADASELEAGSILAATLLVEPNDAELTDGTYTAWLTVTVKPADGTALQPAGSLWTANDDDSITYRKPITIVVDRTPPAAPTTVSAQDQGDGTTLITGTARPGQVVGAVLTTDAENIGKDMGASTLAGLTAADETTGEFQLTVATPANGQSLVPFTASATGTLSLASATTVEGPVGKTPVTVTAPQSVTKTYDGTPAQVNASAAGYPGALEYTWSTADGSAPTDAGSYTVTIRVPASDPKYTSSPVSVSVTIKPAPGDRDPAYREPDGLTAAYGAALSSVTLPSGWAWVDGGTQTLTTTGVHQATYTPANSNYAPVDVGLTVNVDPPAGKTPVTITGLTVDNKTYDGTAVTVTDTPSVTGGYTGTLIYTWQKEDGTVLGGPPKDAGSYKLIVSVPADSEYTGSLTLPFTIAKADGTKDPHYSVPGSLSGTKGSALSTVKLPAGWSWKNGTQTLSATGSYQATYTPTDPNYASVSTALTVTVTGGGQSGGEIGGGGGGGSLPEEPGGETITNPDGSTTTTEKDPDGTVTETTTKPDGTTTITVTDPDGTVTETTTNPDGTTGTAQTDPEGNTTAQVEISQEGTEQGGQPVELPLPDLVPGSDSGSTPTVEITLPADVQSIVVEIPVEDPSPGVVAVVVNEDGSKTVVKQSVPTHGGVLLPLEGSATIRIVDNTQTFIDVPKTAWYYDAVVFVTARGMFSGIGGGRFDPDGTMTRGMQAKMLHNMENNPAPGAADIFLDVLPGAWYADAVNWAAETGVVEGYGNGLYGPDDNITREQLATLLWRYAGSPASAHSLDHFADADQISAYARQAMSWANEHGIINGMGDGRLAPRETVTRAQVAQLLMNFCKYLIK